MSLVMFSFQTQAVLDYATYTANCVRTTWNSNNQNCFIEFAIGTFLQIGKKAR